MSWVPQPDGSTLCEEHGETFRAPTACPKCDGSTAAIEVVDSEVEILNARADDAGLGDEIDDERFFATWARRLRAWAMKAREEEPLSHKAAHNYAVASISAGRAKADLTARRRDWLRYERAARRALGIKEGTPQASALSTALKAASEQVRN